MKFFCFDTLAVTGIAAGRPAREDCAVNIVHTHAFWANSADETIHTYEHVDEIGYQRTTATTFRVIKR